MTRVTIEPNPFGKSEVAYAAYVTAVAGDKSTDSAAMSLGEIWVHHILHYSLSIATYQGDLILIDEPESFLAARAQRPLIDEIAKIALAKDLQLIIGTHSPDILARFPPNCIRMCIRRGEQIRVVTPGSISEIREAVGVETAVRLIILVEDETAREILRIIFARFDVALTRESEIIAAGGRDMVIKGLQALRNSSRLSYAGVLDADQQYLDRYSEIAVFFLPGDGSPEAELISAVGRNLGKLARRLRRANEDIEAAISTCGGMEHQYWIKTIAGHLGLTESELRFELVQLWLRERRISGQAERLTLTIRSLIA